MTVADIMQTMDYGTAPESDAAAQAWLDANGRRFGLFINGAMTEPGALFATRNPARSTDLAEVTEAQGEDVDAAVAAARKAQPAWARAGGAARARVLYALARLVQKHARLLAVLETLDSGKPIRESRDIDIPLVARHFYYHAGMAQLMAQELPDREALGVCGQIVPWNFPLLMLAWKVAPALAMGNTVVLKPAEYTPLTALFFASLCAEAAVPPGVVNIVTGGGAVGERIVVHPGIDRIAFTGSTEVGRQIRTATAGSGKALTLELGGKSPFLIFDDADLDSAIEGLVDGIWLNQGQVCCAGSRLLVQETVAEDVLARLRARMDRLRIGDPLDKSIDIGAIVDPAQRVRIDRLVAASTGEIHRAATPVPAGCYYPPTLVTGLSPADPLMQDEIFGPVLVSATFRTPAEAVALANNTRYGLAATLWTENINLALDLAPKMAAGVVWINATNLLDAAAPFGGLRESGFGREGGWEGLSAYTRPAGKTVALKPVAAVPAPKLVKAPALDRTAKLYVGGRQVRPDGGQSRTVWSASGEVLGQIGLANRKDVRNAVEAAHAARGWSTTTGHARAQILFFVAENLSARAEEFARRLREQTGASTKACEAEVEVALDRLFHWAAWADKHDGAARGVPIRAVALAMPAPVGVIGQFAPDEAPLLGLVSVIAPAVAMGNRVVCVASGAYPLSATDFCQVLDTSDVPGGVVNILTGDGADLAPHLAGHMDVDAVWSFSSAAGLSEVIERESASNLKRTWVNRGRARDWMGAAGAAPEFRDQGTETRTIWIPYGEG